MCYVVKTALLHLEKAAAEKFAAGEVPFYLRNEKTESREKELDKLDVGEFLENVYEPVKMVTTEPMLFREEDREDEKSLLWYDDFIKNFKEEQTKENKGEKDFLWIDKSEGKIKKVYNDPNREKGESYSESRENLIGENIVNVLGGMDKQLRKGIYDNAVDNQLAATVGEWVYSPGATVAKIGKTFGGVLEANDKQYITPAQAQHLNRGQNMSKKMGVESGKEFTAGEIISSEAPEWRRNIGRRITDIYENSSALSYEEQANLRRQKAMEQTKSPAGEFALLTANAVNSMFVAKAYSSLLDIPISTYVALTGGTNKTAEYLEAGYSPLASLGLGIAWGSALKQIEGATSFGRINDGIVNAMGKRIGDKAVKILDEFVDGKTVATVVDLAKKPFVKKILGGIGEGEEEMAEYSLEFVFDSIFGCEDVSFSVKDFLYSGVVGFLAGETFEFSNTINLPNGLRDYFNGKGQAESAEEIKTYFNSVNPKILKSIATGNLELVGKVMKDIPAESFNNALKKFSDVEKKYNNINNGLTTKEIQSIINYRNFANGYRKPISHTLTNEEIEEIKSIAKILDIPEEILLFNEGSMTGFDDNTEKIFIRGNILPDIEFGNTTRDKLSIKAVLAHEYYGHYKNHPSMYDYGDWHDEFRASYDAAVNAPNLSDEERAMLILDAYDRAKEAGIYLDYNEKAREILYGK